MPALQKRTEQQDVANRRGAKETKSQTAQKGRNVTRRREATKKNEETPERRKRSRGGAEFAERNIRKSRKS